MMATQHYQLPIEAILETMSELPNTVVLHASLPFIPGLVPESCVADVIVGEGACHSCTITRSTGHALLQGQEAFMALQSCGNLQWSLDSVSSSKPAPLPQEEPLARQMSPPACYCRRRELTGEEIQTLPHRRKHVFALVNGANTSERIAYLLNKPLQEVQRILADLQTMQLIDLKPIFEEYFYDEEDTARRSVGISSSRRSEL